MTLKSNLEVQLLQAKEKLAKGKDLREKNEAFQKEVAELQDQLGIAKTEVREFSCEGGGGGGGGKI